MEGQDGSRAILMALLNDVQEARIGDLHKMAQRYLNYKDGEKKAFLEQTRTLPLTMKKELLSINEEYWLQRSTSSVIARDADILECLIQAKEYEQQGLKDAQKFMKKGPRFLKTKSARKLWKLCKKMDPNSWWESLGRFHR